MKHSLSQSFALINKVVLIFSVLILFSMSVFAQGPKWTTLGNTNSTGDFIGSTNGQPFVIKTNNITRGTFTASGSFQLNSLIGTASRLLQTDATGNIIPFTMGTSTQVLFGNGTWGLLPTLPVVFWNSSGSNIYFNTGNVGIGTTTPMFPLDVVGDVRISNNLYVGGGIIISDKVNANAEVITGKMKADSIVTDSTKGFYGTSKFNGDVKLASKLSVNGNATINGTATVNGDLKTMGSLIFGGDKRVSYQPASGTTPALFGWGTPISIIGPALPFCFVPSTGFAPTGNVFSGMLYAAGTNPSGEVNLLRMGYDGANGIIDVAGVGATADPALLINYYCGKDIFMCTGGGGYVRTGKNFEVGNPVRNANIAVNIDVLNQTGMFVTTSHTADLNYNTKLAVDRNNTKALAVYNNTTSSENFVVFGDGKVGVRTNAPEAQMHVINPFISGNVGLKITTAGFDQEIGLISEMGNPLGKNFVGGTRASDGTFTEHFVVYADGSVRARDIKVTLGDLLHGDYVFEKNYNLMPLNELENYVKLNSHLPNVPSTAEVEKNNGINLGEMSEKQLVKIEELTLYIIELNKKMNALEKEISILKQK